MQSSSRSSWLTLVGVLAGLLFPFLLGGSPASADEWSDAKKEFRGAQKAKDTRTRREAFYDLLMFDGTDQVEDAVKEVLRSLGREKNHSVIMTAMKTLASFTSDEATELLIEAVQKAKGASREYMLIALADRPLGGGDDLLMALLGGKELRLAAQAALALGRRKTQAALPRILRLLEHDAWQLRSAAARALETMAGVAVLNTTTAKWELPPVPAWLETPEIRDALIQSLETAEGRARSDVVSALERLTGQAYGADLRAWKRLAGGQDPEAIRARPPTVPHVFGIPIYGRKVVVLIDTSTCTDDTHPFQDLARLREVLSVPDARPVALPTVRTTKELYAAHIRRLVMDLPTKGVRFDVIAVSQKIEPLFGKLTKCNGGTKGAAKRFVNELKVANGPNHFLGLKAALDISGKKDSVAWSLGPDEVILMTCAIPWAPKDPNAIVDQGEIGATIGLEARLRMVPIHTIGVGPHPFEMMKTISAQSGGTYLDLSR